MFGNKMHAMKSVHSNQFHFELVMMSDSIFTSNKHTYKHIYIYFAYKIRVDDFFATHSIHANESVDFIVKPFPFYILIECE